MFKLPINTYNIQHILIEKHGWKKYAMPFEEELGIEVYCSEDKRFVIQPEKDSNLCYDAWQLHIDNSDMCTIGHVSVEYIDQILDLMKIYEDY
jgi:hypothetical protein